MKKNNFSKILPLLLSLSFGLLFFMSFSFAGQKTKMEQELLKGESIPKYVNQLPIPPVYSPAVTKDSKTGKTIYSYNIEATSITQQILPIGFPKTKVWGYGGMVRNPATGQSVYYVSSPGPTFEAQRGITTRVKWQNNIKENHMFPVDPTICWADPNNLMMTMTQNKDMPVPKEGFTEAQSNVPLVPHLHGGETQSSYDGHPRAWFTENGMKGPEFITSDYEYLNTQNPTTLWYHDHALGLTRTNVYSGLAGFYILRDMKNPLDNPNKTMLPQDKYEIPIVVQDRTFKKDGSLFFDSKGANPDIHPYWLPEFYGDTIMVNGKVWPNLDVERRQYRFRLLNGSNARFYNFTLSNKKSFVQIGTDGGYLKAPVKRSSILLAPGERADVLIDFSTSVPDTKIRLLNDAKSPYPDGDKPMPSTTGQIMQFTVVSKGHYKQPNKLPAILNRIPKLIPNAPKRTLALYEIEGKDGPVQVLLNGQKFDDKVTELPRIGSTEDWEIVNITGDAHPIHVHLVQFQLIHRQNFNNDKYGKDWVKLNGVPPIIGTPKVIATKAYLYGKPAGPSPWEAGWKDTIQVNPGEIVTIRIRFAPQDAKVQLAKPGKNLFPFNPTVGPGYVWHCHILDHEDNEMMRPFKLKN